MNKRILAISYHTCPLAFEEGKETGGMNVYVYELYKSLGKLGFEIDVYTRCQDKENTDIVEVSENFRVIHLKAGPHSPVEKKKLTDFIPEFVDSFKRFQKSHDLNYDLIHAHYYQSGLIAREIQKTVIAKIPLVMTFHTLALLKNLVARTAAEMDGEFRIETEFELMKDSDAIITPSLSDKEYLQYLYEVSENKIFQIPPGINTRFFKPINKTTAKKYLGLEDKEKIILFVGRIEPLKGIDLLLYALKILVAQASGLAVQLLIVGGDVSQHIKKWSPQLKQLEKLRHTLNISSKVDFVGQQPQRQLPYFYNAAEVVVMPSHYESFGMAAAESMACGTPVITTNVTGISGLIEGPSSTLITSANNPLLLASQIKRLLGNEKLYQEMRKSSLENTRDLSWDLIAKRISDVYIKLIK